MTRRIKRLAVGVLLAGAVALAGCGDTRGETPIVQEAAARLPAVLDGTIAQLASLAGAGGMQIKGYGLVVGLGDKGSSEAPPAIRSALIADMVRRGVDKSEPGAAQFDLGRLIDDKDTAVVAVSAAACQLSSSRLWA